MRREGRSWGWFCLRKGCWPCRGAARNLFKRLEGFFLDLVLECPGRGSRARGPRPVPLFLSSFLPSHPLASHLALGSLEGGPGQPGGSLAVLEVVILPQAVTEEPPLALPVGCSSEDAAGNGLLPGFICIISEADAPDGVRQSHQCCRALCQPPSVNCRLDVQILILLLSGCTRCRL